MDNPVIHVMYTTFAYFMNNISTLCAVVLFFMQFIILAPKAWRQIKKWTGKDKE